MPEASRVAALGLIKAMMSAVRRRLGIVEWFGWGGALKGHLVEAPSSEQGRLRLDEVAQSPVQPDRECLQGWGSYHLSGPAVAVLQRPDGRKRLPCI